MVLTMTEELTEAQRVQADARSLWDAHDQLGYKMSGADLGKKFGKSERWGRDRIAEVRAERQASSPVELPLSLPPVMTPRS